MPIIDPNLQYSFLKISGDTFACSEVFMKYLQIASNANLNRNANTIKAHNTFQKDFIANIEMISRVFDCAIEINDDFIITNYYQFLYDIISDVYFNAYQYRGYTGEVERKDNIWFDQDQHLFYHKS